MAPTNFSTQDTLSTPHWRCPSTSPTMSFLFIAIPFKDSVESPYTHHQPVRPPPSTNPLQLTVGSTFSHLAPNEGVFSDTVSLSSTKHFFLLITPLLVPFVNNISRFVGNSECTARNDQSKIHFSPKLEKILHHGWSLGGAVTLHRKNPLCIIFCRYPLKWRRLAILYQ